MKPLDDLRSDALLVSSCQEENEEAFGVLYSRHFNSIKSLIGAKTGINEHDACDITQKAFIKAMRGIKTFKNQCSFSTWVYRIAYNSFLDSLRGQKDLVSLEIITSKELLSKQLVSQVSEDEPSAGLEMSELADRIARARAKLNKNEKIVFDLIFVEGKPYQEVSKQINVPVGTIMSRVHYTRRKLVKMLQSRELAEAV